MGDHINRHTDNIITPAQLTWREDEQGNTIPISEKFGDVYYSLADGLAESRYVFVEKNRLPQRFKQLIIDAIHAPNLPQRRTFAIAELGFGTGLNVLVTWQLWRQLTHQLYTHNRKKTDDHLFPSPRLHIISTEKYPLTQADLSRSLSSWKSKDASLKPLIDHLLSQYPTLVAGCHRLHLDADVTLDLWFGDAASSLSELGHMPSDPPNSMASQSQYPAYIDAWYLDGFAPSCNQSLWAQHIFTQIQRLSQPDTTVATFSSAGVVKRGLRAAGFAVQKVKGFAKKRHMLIATKQEVSLDDPDNNASARPNSADSLSDSTSSTLTSAHTNQGNQISEVNKVAVVGAGVSGLMAAWSLAQRGIRVALLDKHAPLAGASGNPRALLAPKMTPLAHVAQHLHSIGYLYSQRRYRQMDNQIHQAQDASPTSTFSPIFEPTGTLDLLLKANVNTEQIAAYPEQMATTLSVLEAQSLSGLQQQDLQHNLYLPQAGLVNPRALADRVLAHPNIEYINTEVNRIETPAHTHEYNEDTASSDKYRPAVQLYCSNQLVIDADAVVIATGYDSQRLDSRIFEFRKIRGQLSWFEPTEQQHSLLPKVPLKYGGYCAMFHPNKGDETVNSVTPKKTTFLLGASFIRNDTSTEVRDTEHHLNRNKLLTAIPELEAVIPPLPTGANDTGKQQDKAVYSGWQARVGIRAQTPDYHPLVGRVDEQGLIWTLSGMGSKGYAFAPLCAETLVDMMMGTFPPLPTALLQKLSPQRPRLKKPLR